MKKNSIYKNIFFVFFAFVFFALGGLAVNNVFAQTAGKGFCVPPYGSQDCLIKWPWVFKDTTATDIYNNTGNVGIGTSAPAAKLDVVGGVNVSGNINANDVCGSGSGKCLSVMMKSSPLITNTDKVNYYSGHGVILPGNVYHACNSNFAGGYGCTYLWNYDGTQQKLEARSDGYIYLTHIPTTYSGECGWWLLCTTGYTDYAVWDYLTNKPLAVLYINGCTTCSSPNSSHSGYPGYSTPFTNSLIRVSMDGISTTDQGTLNWSY